MKVRIAVAIDSEGEFQTEAMPAHRTDEAALDDAVCWLIEGVCSNIIHTVIVTAEIPLPPRIAGKVEGAVEG